MIDSVIVQLMTFAHASVVYSTANDSLYEMHKFLQRACCLSNALDETDQFCPSVFVNRSVLERLRLCHFYWGTPNFACGSE